MHDDAPLCDPRAACEALLNDPDLARLDAARAPFDPLAVLGWSAKERAHTRMLAWLMDPRPASPDRAHGLGAAPLRALAQLALETIAPQGFHDIRVWREQPLGDGLAATARAPDLRVEWIDDDGTPWVALVEDKLDAAEGDEQLRDYLAWMRRSRGAHRRLLVYLTPDGRAPASVGAAPELAVVRWGELAGRLLDAIAHAPPSDARDFATLCLRAMRARFEGSPEVRALVASLHARHPAAAELVSTPGGDPAARARVAARYPNAAFLLRVHAPREAPLSAEWAHAVADAFRSLAPQGPRMIVGAPHARCPDRVSWSFEGLSDRLGLHVMAWPGHLLGAARPRLWVAMHGPNRAPAALFAEREHTAALSALPEGTRAWLLAATPVKDPGGSWKWLRLGEESVLPRGFDARDSARRAAEAAHALLGAHLDALARGFAEPALRLFSADLDDDHLLPVDARDREALYAEARPDARHAVILAPPMGARRERVQVATDLGATLAGAYGGTGALSYDYDDLFALWLAPRGRALVVLPLASVEAGDAARLAEYFAGYSGDVVLLAGGENVAAARAALGAVLAPCEGTLARRSVDAPAAVRWDGVTSTLADTRGIAALWTLAPSPGVKVVATASLDGASLPLIATWVAGRARVALFAADSSGMRARPELFARWFRAVLGALEVPLAARVATPEPPAVVSPAVVPPVRGGPRRLSAPTVRRRPQAQTLMPWVAPAPLPQAAFAGRAAPTAQDFDEVVIVDTETTGLSSTSRIVEIGALHVRGGAVVAQFQTLVDPEEPIPRMVVRVHGITDAMVRGAPKAGDAIASWLKFVGGRPLVAHNASFDHRMFAQEMARVGLARPGLSFWCSKRLAKAAFPTAPGYGLAALASWLKLPSPPAHRAVADCLTTHGLLVACRARATDAALSARHGAPKAL